MNGKSIENLASAGQERGPLFVATFLAAALATTLLLAGFLAPAVKADWYFPTSDLSQAGQNATEPKVAIGSDGKATVVWIRANGLGDDIAQASTRSGTGAFSSPLDLSLTGQDAGEPDLATGPDGVTSIVFTQSDCCNDSIVVRTRPAGSSSFSDSIGPSAPDMTNSSPQIAIGPDGTTTVAWVSFDLTFDITTASRAAGAGSYYASQDLVSVTAGNHPKVAARPNGIATVVWIHDGPLVVRAGSSQVNVPVPSWSYQDLSQSGQNAGFPQVASGPDGTTAIVWRRWNGANEIIQAKVRPGSGPSFSSVENLSAAGRDGGDPQVAVGPDGSATAVWQRSNGTNTIVQAATRAAGSSTFSTPIDLSQPGGNASSPQVAVGPDRSTTVVWVSSNGTNGIVQASTRAAGSSTFSAPVDLSQPGQNASQPQVAAIPTAPSDPCQPAFSAVWQRSNGTNTVIQEASAPLPSCTEPAPDPTVSSLGKLLVKGPTKAKKGRKATYRVTVSNTGGAGVTGLRLNVRGRGVKTNKKVGGLAAGKSKVVKMPLRFKKTGKVKLTFTATASNAGSKSATKTVKVK